MTPTWTGARMKSHASLKMEHRRIMHYAERMKYVTCGTQRHVIIVSWHTCGEINALCSQSPDSRTVRSSYSLDGFRSCFPAPLAIRTYLRRGRTTVCVPVQPVCFGAPLSCYMGTHSVARPGCVDARSVLLTLALVRAPLYTLRPACRPSRRLVSSCRPRRQVVNLPRFEAFSAQTDDPRPTAHYTAVPSHVRARRNIRSCQNHVQSNLNI